MKSKIWLGIIVSSLFVPMLTASRGVGGSLSTENSRFVFGQVSEFRRDKYMLDTTNGRLWVLQCIKEEEGGCVSQTLVPVTYMDMADQGGGFTDVAPSAWKTHFYLNKKDPEISVNKQWDDLRESIENKKAQKR